MNKDHHVQTKTVTNLPVNTEAALCYVLGWVSGVVFLLLEKNNPLIRFHAWQSILVFGAISLIALIPGFNVISPLLAIGGFVLWLVLIVRTHQGERLELPLVGDFAKKQAKL